MCEVQWWMVQGQLAAGEVKWGGGGLWPYWCVPYGAQAWATKKLHSPDLDSSVAAHSKLYYSTSPPGGRR